MLLTHLPIPTLVESDSRQSERTIILRQIRLVQKHLNVGYKYVWTYDTNTFGRMIQMRLDVGQAADIN